MGGWKKSGSGGRGFQLRDSPAGIDSGLGLPGMLGGSLAAAKSGTVGGEREEGQVLRVPGKATRDLGVSDSPQKTATVNVTTPGLPDATSISGSPNSRSSPKSDAGFIGSRARGTAEWGAISR